MHYCALLVTKKLPTKQMIDNIMQPYNCNTVYGDEDDEDRVINYPAFTWDWYQIGGRYNAEIKLRVDENDKEYHWGYVEKNRNNRLFISSIMSEIQEGQPEWRCLDDYYLNYFGYADGYILVDGAKISHILNLDNMNCYICIAPDGSAIAREVWNGKDFIPTENFDEKFRKIIEDNREDGYITVLDIHD